MTINPLLAQAEDAAEKARAAWVAFRTHDDVCTSCSIATPCDRRMDLLTEAVNATRGSADALRAYAPPGTYVRYTGNRQSKKGGWIIGGVCRCCDARAYILTRPNKNKLSCVKPREISLSAIVDPEGFAVLVRTAAGEIGHVLTVLESPMEIMVNTQESGHVTVAYASRAMSQARSNAVRSKYSNYTANSERASYVLATLEALEHLATYARQGADEAIARLTHAARVTRDRLAAKATRPPGA
ncbi:hypothetical protein [Streptosporangium sp. NPDC001681]|uniref:hypothetical protein n=1 Tax=Streptosporangium sp. NPDC001681 TaxID=3154395 RepID=UPI0033331674